MTSYINKKICEYYFKTEDDNDEIGEKHIVVGNGTVGGSAGNGKFPKKEADASVDESALLLIPNEENLNYIKKGFYSVRNTLIILSILCCIVYIDGTSSNRVSSSWGFPENSVTTLQNQLVYGEFVIDNKLIITFKGSSSKADFLTDIDFIPIDDKLNIPGKMHKGFYKLLFDSGNYIEILKVLDKYPRDMDIIISGHSLGGGLATLFYAYLKNQGCTNIKLFTFGCPRSGNSEFCDFVSETTRVVNANDIVCSVPLAISYRHPTTKILVGIKKFFTFSRSDHHLVEYYKNILKLED